MHNRQAKLQAFSRLLDILDELRVKCFWDKKQTNESLRTYTIEETYELCDALIRNDVSGIKEELGDVLLQIVFYSKIAEEKQQFDIADVCQSLCDKLIFRHPHVFGNMLIDNIAQISQNWEQLKFKEKGTQHTVLGGIPASLPSLVKAYHIQSKVNGVGFNLDKKDDILGKIQEKFSELGDELARMNKSRIESKFGNLFFSLIKAAWFYEINPDNALERTNQEFVSCFNYIEQKVHEQNKTLKDMTFVEMETLWQEAEKFYK